MNSIYIIPITGQTYTNANGSTYVCLESGGGVTKFERQPDGWTIVAHGVIQYLDGSIEWDFSTGGHWPGGCPKNLIR